MKTSDNISIDKIETTKSETSKFRGIDISNLDTSVNPKDDFYLYACGGWIKNNPLTPEYSQFSTFDQIREKARLQLQELITGLSDNPDSKIKGTNAQKVSDLYAMGMDAERLNSEGATPLRPFIEKIKYTPISDLYNLMAWLQMGITTTFFGIAIGCDPDDSDRYILHVTETGLGLGDRDYYLEKNEENNRILAGYEKYVKRLMQLMGYNEAECRRVWETVIKIETEIASHKLTREERRDPLLRYNKRTMEELHSQYPDIDWDILFAGLGLDDISVVNVLSPKYLEFINSYIATLSEEEIKDYFIYNVVTDSSGLLSDDFQEANFEMFGRIMSGQEEPKPRWKRAMAVPNSMFGEAVGQLYVEKYFPEENKKYMTELVENLREALGKHIVNLSWMSDATKKKALEKLTTLTVKIGYPDKWKDYSELTIDPELSYQENVYKASLWFVKDSYGKLNKPVDKTEWHMTPQTVNAYYNPTTNEICFPAGILQPPYFDVKADDAQNYGAIGVIIGHEMTHGFDDQGRQFDKDGNLKNWWLDEDSAKFNQLADKLVEQFNNIEVAPGVHANGRYTLGENIADQGGLRVAMTAYLDSIKGKETGDIDGFSALQRFFLAYAGVWAGNIRPEEILVRTKTDPHSLGRNRVNVTLRNLQPFFDAFSIEEGDKMYRKEDERVIIW